MKKNVITLTTDFGDSFAQSQVELIVHTINPEARFISVAKEVTEYSIIEGAFIISKFSPFTPKGSVHIGVVDPGVGSERKGLIIKTKNYWFVGPDNGLLYPAASLDGIEEVYTINEQSLGSLSNTFHGRDVFAKVAAYISLEKPIEKYAEKYDKDIIHLIFKENQILHIDPYGNIKFNSTGKGLKYGEIVTIVLNDKKIKVPFCRTFADVSVGKYLLYVGSHNTLELAINQGNAAKDLVAEVGNILTIS